MVEEEEGVEEVVGEGVGVAAGKLFFVLITHKCVEKMRRPPPGSQLLTRNFFRRLNGCFTPPPFLVKENCDIPWLLTH